MDRRPAAERVAAITRALGASVDDRGPVRVAGIDARELTIACDSNEEAIDLLNAYARDDAADGPRVRALAGALAAWCDRAAPILGTTARALFARRAHALVRDGIAYVDDPDQVYRSSDVTLALAAGNCVNSARVVCALCLAAGVPARIVGVRDADGEIAHACAQIDDGDGWRWAEATFPARFGVDPRDEAERLGVAARDDIARGGIYVSPPWIAAA